MRINAIFNYLHLYFLNETFFLVLFIFFFFNSNFNINNNLLLILIYNIKSLLTVPK